MSPPRDPTSDSEDDSDYVPPEHQDSDSSADEEGNDKADVAKEVTEEDQVEQKKARDALWASFQASIATLPPPRAERIPIELVKVEKQYLFAGKNIVEVIEVPKDSEEAKRWPRWYPSSELSSTTQQTSDSSSSATEINTPASSSVVPTPPPAQKSAPAKPLGPRKPRKSLADIPTQKVKKITTLDKSAMDWRAHVTSSDVKDELDANRRGGGYLEKMDFLQRVEDRREDVFEANKSNKRRKI